MAGPNLCIKEKGASWRDSGRDASFYPSAESAYAHTQIQTLTYITAYLLDFQNATVTARHLATVTCQCARDDPEANAFIHILPEYSWSKVTAAHLQASLVRVDECLRHTSLGLSLVSIDATGAPLSSSDYISEACDTVLLEKSASKIPTPGFRLAASKLERKLSFPTSCYWSVVPNLASTSSRTIPAAPDQF
eukprot:gene16610-22852_t